MARVGPFPMSTPPVYPGVYEIEGWGAPNRYTTYARFDGGGWLTGGALTPDSTGRGDSLALNSGLADLLYHWYGVDEATSKGQA